MLKYLGFNLSSQNTLYIISFLSIFSMIILTYYLSLKISSFIINEYNKLTRVEKKFIFILVILGFFFYINYILLYKCFLFT